LPLLTRKDDPPPAWLRAPEEFWAAMVTSAAAAEIAKSGIFSARSVFQFPLPRRFSGQWSMSSRMRGRVTSICFDRRPRAKQPATGRYRLRPGFRA